MHKTIKQSKTRILADWKFIVWISLGSSALIILARSDQAYPEPLFTLSIYSLNILCIAIAASCGVLLGLTISSMFSSMQYSSSSMATNRAIVYHEYKYVDAGLKRMKLVGANISEVWTKLCDICARAWTITEKEMEAKKIDRLMKSFFSNLQKSIKSLTGNAKKLNGVVKEPSTKDRKREKDIIKETQELYDLLTHANTIFGSLLKIRALFLVIKVARLLRNMAYLTSIILGWSITLIILTNVQLPTGSFFTDSNLLYAGAHLLWAFSGILLFLFEILSIHSSIVGIETGTHH